MMDSLQTRHTFAICAYKESPYLEECMLSLKGQTLQTGIICVTSTPCAYIEKLCEKYQIPYFVNTGEHGITQDWNFAVSKCSTDYVTVAHQDDLYFDTYAEKILNAAEKAKNPIIVFSDYDEIRDGERVHNIKNLKIKRMLLFPLRARIFSGSKWIRRRAISLGNPICCPAVTFNRRNTPEVLFHNHFRSNEDWETWEDISKRKGQFIYIKEPLMGHRIHEESTTSEMIQDNARGAEDFEMFRKFWPKGIAKLLCKAYSKSEDSNEL